MTPRRPLLFFLPIQAAILCWRLDLLPAWGDEYATLHRAGLSTAELLAELRMNVHPPLYFLLARGWLELPLPFDALVRLRVLSVLCALLATVAIDRWWLEHASRRTRVWFLALWTVSPCLLLYARMARSYSLQLLLSSIALYAAWRLLERPRERRALAVYSASLAALFGTHYLPATAIAAALAAAMLWKLAIERRADFAVPLLAPAIVLAAVAIPYWRDVTSAFEGVVRADSAPIVAGVPASLTALAYTGVAFAFGEIFPPAVAAGAALVAPLLAFAALGARRRPGPRSLLVLGAAAVAFCGAIRWVSAPFVPARLLFLLPAPLLWLVRTTDTDRVLGRAALSGLLVVWIASAIAYFRADGFLNAAYVVPYPRIAARIAADSPAEGAPLFLDHERTNVEAIELYLPARVRVTLLPDEAAEREMWNEIARTRPRVAWILRSTRSSSGDLGPTAAPYAVRRDFYVPYGRFVRYLMRLTRGDAPGHALELIELRKPSP